jgi:hypothetical protein
MLEDVLDGIGFGGLWRSSTFHASNEQDRQGTALTDRLIEVSLFCSHHYLRYWLKLYTADHCIKARVGMSLRLQFRFTNDYE